LAFKLIDAKKANATPNRAAGDLEFRADCYDAGCRQSKVHSCRNSSHFGDVTQALQYLALANVNQSYP
jgi:hypothetical protein